MLAVLQIVGLVMAFLKYMPQALTVLKEGSSLLDIVKLIFAGHKTNQQATRAEQVVASLKDTHSLIQAHLNPEHTVTVDAIVPTPIILQKVEDATTKEDAIINSTEFQKIEHPDLTQTDDYLKKYE